MIPDLRPMAAKEAGAQLARWPWLGSVECRVQTSPRRAAAAQSITGRRRAFPPRRGRRSGASVRPPRCLLRSYFTGGSFEDLLRPATTRRTVARDVGLLCQPASSSPRPMKPIGRSGPNADDSLSPPRRSVALRQYRCPRSCLHLPGHASITCFPRLRAECPQTTVWRGPEGQQAPDLCHAAWRSPPQAGHHAKARRAIRTPSRRPAAAGSPRQQQAFTAARRRYAASVTSARLLPVRGMVHAAS